MSLIVDSNYLRKNSAGLDLTDPATFKLSAALLDLHAAVEAHRAGGGNENDTIADWLSTFGGNFDPSGLDDDKRIFPNLYSGTNTWPAGNRNNWVFASDSVVLDGIQVERGVYRCTVDNTSSGTPVNWARDAALSAAFDLTATTAQVQTADFTTTTEVYWPVDTSARGATSELVVTLPDGKMGDKRVIFDVNGSLTDTRTIRVSGRFQGATNDVILDVPWGAVIFDWSGSARGWIPDAKLLSAPSGGVGGSPRYQRLVTSSTVIESLPGDEYGIAVDLSAGSVVITLPEEAEIGYGLRIGVMPVVAAGAVLTVQCSGATVALSDKLGVPSPDRAVAFAGPGVVYYRRTSATLFTYIDGPQSIPEQVSGVPDGIWVTHGATIAAGVNAGVDTDGTTVVSNDGEDDYDTAVVTIEDGTEKNQLTVIKARGDAYVRMDGKINGDAAAQVIVNQKGAAVLLLWDDLTDSHWTSADPTFTFLATSN